MIVFLFLIFVVLCGKWSLEVALLGLAAALGVFAFCCAFMGHSIRRELLCYRLIPFALGYLLLLLWEMLKAALSVLGVLYKGTDVKEGKVVSFHSGLQSDLLNTLLADSITLTPGTVTVHAEGDCFLVHGLTPSMTEDLENCVFVRRLRKLDRLLLAEREKASAKAALKQLKRQKQKEKEDIPHDVQQ